MGQPEPAADEKGVAEELLDLIRMGVGADVEIGRLAAEHQVADGSSDEIGGESMDVQPVEHLEAVGIDVAARDAMPRPVEDERRLELRLSRSVGGFFRIGHGHPK